MSITDPLIGKKLGDYNIAGVLGTGGMARVYRGYDDNLDRYAAIKVVEPQLIASTEESDYRERFLREARAIARLNHPRIVSIYQFNQIGSLYYIAMEYAEGDNLRDKIKGYIKDARIMPTQELLKVLRDIADALDYAHQQGIIHRDIKPSNIIINRDGNAMLTDFGLALNAMEGTVGNSFGSVHYIAPEQAISSANAVPQSDQYSLGIVAYELLTGRVPFDDASAMSIALMHISDPPPPPTELNPNIPAEVEQVILKALDKDPTKRFETSRAFVSALELAFDMLENADIEAPKSLTEARGEPPKTNVLPPDEQEVGTKELLQASRLRESQQTALQTKATEGRTKWLVGMGVVIVLFLAFVFLFGTGVFSQNPSGTETAIAVLQEQTNNAHTQSALDIRETNSAATDFAQETRRVATLSAGQTSTSDANTEIVVAQTQNVFDEQATSASETEIAQAVITSATVARQVQSTQLSSVATATETTLFSTLTLAPSTPTTLPTGTATPEFLITNEFDTRQVLLRYDGRSLMISNRDSEHTLDLSDLTFVLFEPNEDGDIVETVRLSIGSTNLEAHAENMIPERCLQILDTLEYSGLPNPNRLADGLCTALPFWTTVVNPFWVSDAGEAYFEARLGPVDVIAICEVQPLLTRAEQRCAFGLDLGQ